MSKPCVKQLTVCVITRETGQLYHATNTCEIEGSECPRVIANKPTGEGYELCGSSHAEANAAVLAEESKDSPGFATLYGHTWICKACQDALRAVNVHCFMISDVPAQKMLEAINKLVEQQTNSG